MNFAFSEDQEALRKVVKDFLNAKSSEDTVRELMDTEAGYDQALRNETTNARDNVFADGVEHQLLTVSGDVASGLKATFTAVV